MDSPDLRRRSLLAIGAVIGLEVAGCGGGSGGGGSGGAGAGTSGNTGTVTTLAGTGAAGSANGPGAAASFNSPSGVAVDGTGRVYVADASNNLIRTIDGSGNVTTLAGSAGAFGSANGQGTNAFFYYPTAVQVDSTGNVYVADTNNHLIRKIDGSANVTTLAGSGTFGSANGLGAAASFFNPSGVAVDSARNVYVGDTGNHLIRKIDSSGNVTTLAGSGVQGAVDAQGTAASFNHPQGLAVDGAGIVYVADTNNHLIRKIDTSGNVVTLAGSGLQGYTNDQGTAASFSFPQGVALDSAGNLYVADYGSNAIRKIDRAGNVTTLAGSGTLGSANGQGAAASFYSPSGVAVGSTGAVYVSDTLNNLIRVIK